MQQSKLNKREKDLAYSWYRLSLAVTLLWIPGILISEQLRDYFFAGTNLHLITITADAISLILLIFLLISIKKSQKSNWLAWLYFIFQGFGWLISLVLATEYIELYLGFILMTFSSGINLAIALMLSEFKAIIHPKNFKKATPKSTATFRLITLFQTLFLWFIFLYLFPTYIQFIDQYFNFNIRDFKFDYVIFTGWGLFIFGTLIGLWSGQFFAIKGSGTPLPISGSHKLITTGPYKYIRNPMATCGIIQGIGVSMILVSPLTFIYSLLGALWWEALARGAEERYLEKEFGDEYLEYQSQVPCWYPRLKIKT